jgi:hypothetical protein
MYAVLSRVFEIKAPRLTRLGLNTVSLKLFLYSTLQINGTMYLLPWWARYSSSQ